MNVFEMVVIIVVFSVGAGVINNYLKSRDAGRRALRDLAPELKRLDALEERVRVLEAVVTDHNWDLQRQFRDLEKE
jgi:hypothetical protein